MGLLPFGERLFDIAADFRHRLADAQSTPERSAALVELVTVTPSEVRIEAETIAAEVAAGEPAEAQQKLTQYLQLAPLTTQQSLRRPEDPSGTTVPPLLGLDDVNALVPFIPPAPPRFQPGDAPPSLHGWVLVQRLGAGGFGEVWQVRHPHAKNVFAAVKFCLDQKAHQVLMHEKHVIDQVMSLGALPAIVPLLDFDLESEPPYLKYQFVPGGDLLEFASHFSGTKATTVIRNLAETVGRFHRLQPPVVHRDLKPSNILVEKEALPTGGSRLHLRIADFGIGGAAAVLDQGRARTLPSAVLPTVLLGSHSALYASKQQKQGAKPDPRDDVFALGVLWYQLLIGDLTSERPSGNLRKKVAALGLPDGLVGLLESCCDYEDPKERPKDALEMAERIRSASSTGPSAPGPPHLPPPLPPDDERTARHTEARDLERGGLYAEAAAALEVLSPELRDAVYYQSLLQRRDEVAALQRELYAAADNNQLTERHRAMALRWKQLQPFRAVEIDAILAKLPRRSTPAPERAPGWALPRRSSLSAVIGVVVLALLGLLVAMFALMSTSPKAAPQHHEGQQEKDWAPADMRNIDEKTQMKQIKEREAGAPLKGGDGSGQGK
jgi:serine/threonine protein kinase